MFVIVADFYPFFSRLSLRWLCLFESSSIAVYSDMELSNLECATLLLLNRDSRRLHVFVLRKCKMLLWNWAASKPDFVLTGEELNKIDFVA